MRGHQGPRLRRGLLVVLASLAVASAATACADEDTGAANQGSTTKLGDEAALIRQVALERTEKAKVDFSTESLVFPPGTSYGEALREFFMIEAGVARDTDAALGRPLAAGAVVSLPEQATGSLKLSLGAPYGYDVASERPLLSPLRAPAEGTAPRQSAAGPWLKGSALPVPTLPECMISRGDRPPASGCADDDVVRLDGQVVALP